MQALAELALAQSVLYVSGEESGQQVALRARRLQVDASAVKLLTEINLERIVTVLAEEKPAVSRRGFFRRLAGKRD